MDEQTLKRIIQQPEGLKLDFKQEFYHLDLTDREARNRQWDELIKDVLALANGNVNIAGETGYIIFGVADKAKEDGTREVFDVGTIKVTRQQILDKVNSCSNPPLPDIECDLLLLDTQRVFVVSILPTPYIHETTKRLITSKGQSFPEHTVFIRRGEGTHMASMAEIQSISAEKQRSVRSRSLVKRAITLTPRTPALIDAFVILICTCSGSLIASWGYLNDTKSHGVLGGIVGLLIGIIFGFVFALVMKALQWVIARRPSTKAVQTVALWLPIVALSIFGFAFGKDLAESLLGVVLAGPLFGLPIGVVFAGTVWILDWTVGKLRSEN